MRPADFCLCASRLRTPSFPAHEVPLAPSHPRPRRPLHQQLPALQETERPDRLDCGLRRRVRLRQRPRLPLVAVLRHPGDGLRCPDVPGHPGSHLETLSSGLRRSRDLFHRGGAMVLRRPDRRSQGILPLVHRCPYRGPELRSRPRPGGAEDGPEGGEHPPRGGGRGLRGDRSLPGTARRPDPRHAPCHWRDHGKGRHHIGGPRPERESRPANDREGSGHPSPATQGQGARGGGLRRQQVLQHRDPPAPRAGRCTPRDRQVLRLHLRLVSHHAQRPRDGGRKTPREVLHDRVAGAVEPGVQ